MSRPRVLTLAVAALAAAFCLANVAAAAAATCGGKRATIVSNAAKIVGTKAPDVIAAGGRRNVILGRGGNDRICGGGGNDAIRGEKGSDRLFGQGGNDLLDGYRGRDTLRGGSGSDRLYGNRGSDDLNGGGGRDRVFGDTGNDRVNGGGGARDYVDGGLGDEPLASGGGGGYDVVVGGAGIDHIDGGPGPHDIASYAGSTSNVNADLENGRVIAAERESVRRIEDVLGGPGNDILTGNLAANRLDGGPGDDHLNAKGGGDEAFGGPGSDRCIGGFARENSCGGSRGGGGVEVELIRSITGAASLAIGGTNGDDAISVRRGNGGFTVTSGGQTRLSSGGSCNGGGTTVFCPGSASMVLATMGGGTDSIDASGVGRGVQAVLDGQAGSDTVRGGPAKDTLYSGDDRAPDRLYGGGGVDILFGVNTAHPRNTSGGAVMNGGGGNDLMVGGQPCDGDVYNGGGGANDSASFARVRNSGIFVQATIGGGVSDPDIGSCNAGRITGSTEKIEGSPGPDRLFGDGSANTLLGRGGNDFLNGKGGRDNCVGGGGGDRAVSCERRSSIP